MSKRSSFFGKKPLDEHATVGCRWWTMMITPIVGQNIMKMINGFTYSMGSKHHLHVLYSLLGICISILKLGGYFLVRPIAEAPCTQLQENLGSYNVGGGGIGSPQMIVMLEFQTYSQKMGQVSWHPHLGPNIHWVLWHHSI